MVLVIALTTASCGSADLNPAKRERIAILPFENLSGDPSIDWIRTAGPSILHETLAAHTRPNFFRSPGLNDAYQGHATEFLHTTYTKNGSAYRFRLEVENADSHRMTSDFSSNGNVLFAINAIARHLQAAAVPFSTHKEEALEAWGRGDSGLATTIDPDFGAAWLSFVQQLVSARKATEALEAAEKALGRASLRSEWHRAHLQVTAANLRGDLPGSLAALTRLARMTPSDTEVLFILAEAEMGARKMEEAISRLRSILEIDPANPRALNSLGYAEAIAGRLEVARTTLENYGRQPAQGINALDSLGEAHFMNGRFREAASYFHQAYSRNPSFLNGATLRKAAYAEWLGGNLAGADATMAPHFASLAQRGGEARAIAEASWLFTTGRRALAVEKFSSLQFARSEIGKQQLAVFKGELAPPSDASSLKKLYEGTPPAQDGMARVFYAATLLAAGKRPEALELLKRWPLPDDGAPPFQSLVFDRFLELRKSLGL